MSNLQHNDNHHFASLRPCVILKITGLLVYEQIEIGVLVFWCQKQVSALTQCSGLNTNLQNFRLN